jgi:hypothetical protein
VADLVPGAGFLVLGGVLLSLGRWRRRLPVRPVSATFHAPRRWLITDDGMDSWTDLTTTRYDWSAFRSVTELPMAYLFQNRDGVIVDVPREPLTADEDAAIRTVLKHRRSRPTGPGPAMPPSAMRIEFASGQAPQYVDGPAPPSGSAAVRRQWVITEEFLQVTGAGCTRAWRWPAVRDVKVRPQAYLFFQEDGSPVRAAAFDVPRKALSAAQEAELRAFLVARDLLVEGSG